MKSICKFFISIYTDQQEVLAPQILLIMHSLFEPFLNDIFTVELFCFPLCYVYMELISDGNSEVDAHVRNVI